MKKILIGILTIFILSCGQNYHLSLEELSSVTPPVTPHNSTLTGPVGPIGFTREAALEGSCHTEGANKFYFSCNLGSRC